MCKTCCAEYNVGSHVECKILKQEPLLLGVFHLPFKDWINPCYTEVTTCRHDVSVDPIPYKQGIVLVDKHGNL
jgi:hypothetical protein